MYDWHLLTDFFHDKHRLLITSHVQPDGDAIGSEVAMAHYLRQVGKKAVLINCEATPQFFQFMDPHHEIMTFNAQQHREMVRSVDGCIVVDVSDWNRLAGLGLLIKEFGLAVACLDHHIPTDQLGKVQMIDQKASSTGELIYDLILSTGGQMNQEIVDALYTCIMTDTGSFRFSNTTALTHMIAADLMQKGANFRTIYEYIYEQNSKERTLLMGRLLTKIQFAYDGRLAYFTLPQSLLRETGAELWQTEGFSELPRNIAGVEICMMFTEIANGRTKVSIRSKGSVPINGLAIKLGGGGHTFASGVTLNLSLEDAVKAVVAVAKELFSSGE